MNNLLLDKFVPVQLEVLKRHVVILVSEPPVELVLFEGANDVLDGRRDQQILLLETELLLATEAIRRVAAAMSHVSEQIRCFHIRSPNLLNMTVMHITLLSSTVEIKMAQFDWLEGSLRIGIQLAEGRIHHVKRLRFQYGFRLPNASVKSVIRFLVTHSSTEADLVANVGANDFKKFHAKLLLKRLVDAVRDVAVLVALVSWHNDLLGRAMLEAQRVRHCGQAVVSSRVEDAGCLSTAGANAATQVLLNVVTNILEVEAKLTQAVSVLVIQAQVDHRLFDGFTRQKLRGDHIEALHVLLYERFVGLDCSLVDSSPQRVSNGLEHNLLPPVVRLRRYFGLLVSFRGRLVATPPLSAPERAYIVSAEALSILNAVYELALDIAL